MTDYPEWAPSSERERVLAEAIEHQYDTDDDAKLLIETDDPVLIVAEAIINRWGAWDEVMITASPEFLELCEIAVRAARGDRLHSAVRWVLEDAAYKAPEQVGAVSRRWIDALQAAVEDEKVAT